MQPEEVVPSLPPAKIGGWLLVFLVTEYLGCLSLAIQTMRPQPVERTLLLILMFVATFLPAVLVGRRSQLIFPALWMQAGVRLAVTFFNGSILWRQRAAAGPNAIQDVSNQVAAVACIVLWLLYFRSSRRVRETFGHTL
jgi:hypothetical protein